jgi:hypothetical protein
LQRRIAGDVAVLAARMLEHGLDRGEGRERGVFLAAFRGPCPALRGRGEWSRRADRRGSKGSALFSSPQERRSGSSRRRFPVNAKTAFATAGAIEGLPGSPAPPDFSRLSKMWTSTCGAHAGHGLRRLCVEAGDLAGQLKAGGAWGEKVGKGGLGVRRE